MLTQEDGSDCSIFSFDITTARSRLPLARNALKKLRTMRHPGVIKVLDTVEVGKANGCFHRSALTHDQDGDIHLHCYRAPCTFAVARSTKEPRARDHKMGIT